MDPFRFDRLTRLLGYGASRRATFGGLLAALVPGAAAAKPKDKTGRDDEPNREPDRRTDAAKCLANGQRCGKGSGKRGKNDTPCKRCCSRYATPTANGPQRCSCKPANAACTNSAQCCGGQCTGGQCGPCQPGLTLCQPDGCVDTQTNQDNCGACANACAAGQVCQGGACACTTASCPDGCCGENQCKPGTGDAFCGRNGGVCAACVGIGVTCGGGGTPGVCGCTPASDAATCDGKCGTVQNNCGQDVNCTPLCVGCCDGGTCRPGDTTANCGSGGAVCDTCVGNELCDGVCRAPRCGDPGETCLVFVTSSTSDGDLGGIAGADATCQGLADDANLDGTFYAWLADSTSAPSDRFTRAAGPYKLVDGTTVADDWDDLLSGASIDNPIGIDQTGAAVGAGFVWTNVSAYTGGPQISSDCGDWTRAGGSGISVAGTTTATNESWTNAGQGNCGFADRRLYCFQQS